MLHLPEQEAGVKTCLDYRSQSASLPGWDSRTTGPERFVDCPRALESSQANNSLHVPGSKWLRLTRYFIVLK